MQSPASTQYEYPLWQSGIQHIAGTDEVGRGAWAGPLVIAAVILPPYFTTTLPITDSKKISYKVREQLASYIKEIAVAYSIIEVDLPTINQLGIGKAADFGFAQAIQQLSIRPGHILVDAFSIPGIPLEKQQAIIHGDSLSISIAAASIIAKVHRDNLMHALHQQASEYGFNQHVGYGTAQHRAAIKQHGLSLHHRTSYNLDKWL